MTVIPRSPLLDRANTTLCFLVLNFAILRSYLRNYLLNDHIGSYHYYEQYDRYRRSCYGKKMEKLEEAMKICLELDQALKGNRYREDVSLERAVIRIARLCGGEK